MSHKTELLTNDIVFKYLLLLCDGYFVNMI
jgi:hypothetical protein